MKTKRNTKNVTLKLRYTKSKIDRENGIYIGGVAKPRYLNELIFDIADDYNFDLDAEEFYKNGMFAMDITGTSRALKEFGKFLVNMAMLKTEDEGYHEHIDQIKDSTGKPMVNLTVRKL